MNSRIIPLHPAESITHSSCEDGEPFALMVLGDSMEPEFIEGDIVVVEPSGYAACGAFVVARAVGEWALRRLDRCADQWILSPLNPRYDGMLIASLNDVKGVVIQRTHPRLRGRRKRYIE